MGVNFVDVEGAQTISGGVAVIVDVMRAYTVAAWALHHGSKQIVLVGGIEEAVELAASLPGSLLFKDGVPDPRFDLHNSPRQLLDLDVAGRTIVQRTTAGTQGAIAARHADQIHCASFVCASATGEAVKHLYIQRALNSDAAADLRRGVERGFTGVTPEDVQMCAELDRFDFAMEANHRSGHLTLTKKFAVLNSN